MTSSDLRGSRAVSRRTIIEVAVLVVALVAVAGLLWSHFRPDPYGPGTSHRYTVEMTGPACPNAVELDGKTWDPASPGSRSKWSDWQYPLNGTFHIEVDGNAAFTPDEGGTLTFHGGTKWSQLSCPVF